MPRDDRPRLLVLRALGLGDFLTAVPALKGLAEWRPDHRRLLAAPLYLEPLAGLLGWEVVPSGPLEPLSVSGEIDLAFNLHGRGPQSHRVLLNAGIRRCIWFFNEDVPESSGSPRWFPGEHEVQRWCRLLLESGIPCDPSRLSISLPQRLVPFRRHGITLIHPGAAAAARRWPAERWAEVARAEVGRGRSVVLTGSAQEVSLAGEIASLAGLPSGNVAAGKTGLLDLAALVAGAGRVACCDTGVAHLATALDTPSVILFGPTSPAEWGPPRSPGHKVIWKGSTSDPNGNQVDPGLLLIRPEEVIEALGLLEPEASPLVK